LSGSEKTAWLNANPSAFASLASATIAASVALVVFAVTQFITGKRNRAAFLTSKLEELYLLLNEMGEKNAAQFDLLMLCLAQDKSSTAKLREMGSVELFGGSRAKKMIMLIRLYFPQLTRIHQRLFAAELDYSKFKHRVREGDKIGRKELLSASFKVGRCIRLLENELITNQSVLLRSRFFPTKYRETSETEIQKVMTEADERLANDSKIDQPAT
jgi:hypothetical protein